MVCTFDSSAGPPVSAEVLRHIGYLGHYLRIHGGGRGGKQFVLISLHQNGGHLTQKELFERSCTSSAAMSEVLAKLEAEGLIRRTTSDRDRRQLDVTLTEEGQKRAQTLFEEHSRFDAVALACLSDDEVTTLATLLAKVCDHWEGFEKEEVSA